MSMKLGWKNHIRLLSRVAATYLLLAAIEAPSKAFILAGMAGLLYLIACFVADGKNSAD